VLLLDEPAAGVPSAESHIILDAVDALPKSIGVLIIDHDMDLVFRFAKYITVLVAISFGCLARRIGTAHQHGDVFSKTEHEIHVVVDDKHANGFRQRVDGVKDDMTFGAGHACGRLVEQQHFGLQSERDGEFDQPLAA